MAAVLAMASSVAVAQTALTPEAVVQGQVDAYNRHDTRGFADFYSDDVEFFDLGPSAKPTLSGRAALIAQYDPIFNRYKPSAAILSRSASGAFVVDRERVTAQGHAQESLAIYQVENGKIRRVWFTP